jgi:hypothetical protein
MRPQPDEASRIQTELLILRAMCQGTPQGSVRTTALHILKDYRWREPVHQVMFQCLARLPGENPELLRNELPACLTRKGFPDVDWDTFFAPHSPTPQEAERMMLELRKSQVPAPRASDD